MAERLSASGSSKRPSSARLSGAVLGDGCPGRVDGERYHSGGRALPEMDPVDAGTSKRGKYADLYAGEYPGVVGGAWEYASGGVYKK